MVKEDTKKYINLGAKNIETPHPVTELESNSRSLWEERAYHTETAEWIRKEERREVRNMDE